jgi:hypothetical protein
MDESVTGSDSSASILIRAQRICLMLIPCVVIYLVVAFEIKTPGLEGGVNRWSYIFAALFFWSMNFGLPLVIGILVLAWMMPFEGSVVTLVVTPFILAWYLLISGPAGVLYDKPQVITIQTCMRFAPVFFLLVTSGVSGLVWKRRKKPEQAKFSSQPA